MLKIIKNPDKEIYDAVTADVYSNDGYCPCMTEQTENTKCPCEIFRRQETVGECHCGRYIKVESEDK